MRGDDIMAKADRNRATATSRMDSRPSPSRSSARRTPRKPAEPRLLTRPEVAEALGVSERTARRMAGDPSCPLGPGERRMRKLYWTSEAVEDARLWRAEQEHRAEAAEAPAAPAPTAKPAPKAKAAAQKAKAAPKNEAAPKPAPKAKSAKAKPATAKSSKASAAETKLTETRSAAKPKPASKSKPAAKPQTAAKPARKPAQKAKAKSAPPKRTAASKQAPAAAAPVPLTPAALFDTETLAALLPLLDADMRLLSPARQAEMLRAAGAALRRLLGPALAAARAQAGLPPVDRPEPPALGRLNRYEFSVLARSARMAAPLMPPRRPWATAG